MQISAVWIFVSVAGIMLMIHYIQGQGLSEMFLSLILLMSPLWLIMQSAPMRVPIKIKRINWITIAICFLVGLWLFFDLKDRPLKYEQIPVSSYTITNGKNVLVIEFQKTFRTQIVNKVDVGDYNIDSLKVFEAAKTDIFGEKLNCNLYLENNKKKIYTRNIENYSN